MQVFVTDTLRPRRTWTAALAGGLTAAVLIGSVVPSRAAHDSTRAGFHHHFYRGQQLHAVHRRASHLGDGVRLGYGAPAFGLGVAGAAADTVLDAAAMTADVEPSPESVAYCSDRFRSYDPSTGTYLGYDGLEHTCP